MSKRKFNIEYLIKLQALFENPVAGFIIFNPDASMEAVNKTMARQLQMDKEEIEGRSVHEFLDEHDSRLMKLFMERFLKNEKDSALEVNFIPSNGTDNTLEMAVAGSHLDGEIIFIGISKDISVEKNLRDELENQQQAHKKSIKSLKKESAFNEMIKRFVDMAAHEFKTPLSEIFLALDLIKRYTEEDGLEWQKFTYHQQIEKQERYIRDAALRIKSVLNGFLSLSTIESGDIQVEKTEFNLKSYMESYKDKMADLVKDRTNISFNLEEADHNVKTDSQILTGIMNNLMSNALKYSGNQDEISVEARVKDHKLFLIVEDGGDGIDDEDQPNIYQVFFRGSNSFEKQGSGLGLTITRKYLDMLNGDISFASKKGDGTNFEITIPLDNHE